MSGLHCSIVEIVRLTCFFEEEEEEAVTKKLKVSNSEALIVPEIMEPSRE